MLGRFYLPGLIVILGNNSAVLSAACHVVPLVAPSNAPDMDEGRTRGLHGFYCHCAQCTSPVTRAAAEVVDLTVRGEDELPRMAQGKLKWGVVSSLPMRDLRFSPMQLAHLAFGSPAQRVRRPEEGEMYAGI